MQLFSKTIVTLCNRKNVSNINEGKSKLPILIFFPSCTYLVLILFFKLRPRTPSAMAPIASRHS